MAKHARGLICLSITADRARQLRLPPMSSDNQSGHGTAFTVSIEAREGVTTGISAHDRAHTIAVAVDPTKGMDEIVSPGHVFPLVARDGGVLVRAGHTEAAVDISRMAGLNPAGVICEIMKDDGSMARLPDLVAFAQLHGLKIGTIADLIAYRRRTERQVERVLETPFESAYGGKFRMVIYRNSLDQTEHAVLTKGRIEPDIKIALNTGFTKVITDSILARLHWNNGATKIDFVISSDEVPKGRPYPFMIETIMRQLNINDPHQVVKVGDTEVDVLEGRNAYCGLVVSVTTGAYTREQLQQYNPDHIIDSLSELPSLIL